MCIIVYKPAKIDLKDYILENCFDNNPDGACFSYLSRDSQLKTYRGLMTYEDFKRALKQAKKDCNYIDTAFLFHFRISTENGVKPSLTHCFPLDTSNDFEDIKRHVYKCPLVVHNGIISITKPSLVDKRNSDTTIFIDKVLSKLNDKQLADDEFIASIANNSKLAIMYPNGSVKLLNKSAYKIDDGVYYSNTSYKDIYSNFYYDKYFGSYYMTECEKHPVKYNCRKCRYYDTCKNVDGLCKSKK